jgi:hypothetical protein
MRECEPSRNDKSKEVRLGLVLYGGISLAIYMNGVTEQFFNAVRGRGVYGLIKHLTDSDIVVDIASGTSAGGINGILLAYALVNEMEFTDCAQLWRKDGGIGDLLHKLSDGINPSVLRSETYYQPRLQAAFATMQPIGEKPHPPEVPSETSELDLFVTGTDVQGNTYTQFDDQGHHIDVKNHRSVFQLKYRLGRPDNPDNIDLLVAPGCPEARKKVVTNALGKLAQITSAFPFAFAPVAIPEGPTAWPRNVFPADEDTLLRRWATLSKVHYFVDGGVLNNAPFTSTLKAIFQRTANRMIERHLCYVEPSPEHFASLRPKPPLVRECVLGSLGSIPRYQSIAEDLQSISEHNSQIEQYSRVSAALVARLAGNSLPKEDSWDPHDPIYTQSRLLTIIQRAVRGILKENGQEVEMDPTKRDLAKQLFQAAQKWRSDQGTEILRGFDIYYRQRRLFYIVYAIFDRLYGAGAPTPISPQADRLVKVWDQVNQRIQLLEIIQRSMETLIDLAAFDWQDLIKKSSKTAVQILWSQVEVAFKNLLDSTGSELVTWGKNPTIPNLSKINSTLKSRARELGQKLPDTSRIDYTNLLIELDESEADIFAPLAEADITRRSYLEFATLDRELLELELVSGLHERDVIRLTRFSPEDATQGYSGDGKTANQPKVLGLLFGHFGAFMKESWRVNDMLWGRLDGTCQLIDLLLNPQAMDRVWAANSQFRGKIREKFLDDSGEFRAAMEPRRFMPNCGEQVDNRLRAVLTRFFDGDYTENDRAEFVAMLIRAAQNETLEQQFANSFSKKEFSSAEDYFLRGYKVASQGIRNLMTLSAVPVACKAFFATVKAILGLKRKVN